MGSKTKDNDGLMKKKRFSHRRRITFIIVIICLLISTPFIVNEFVKNSTKAYMINEEEAGNVGADCILVLGAGLKPDGTPNYMLRDRLDLGIKLYKDGVAPKLLLSGDNGQERYDEVNAMKTYTLDAGVPSEDIFMDHAGFSTYDSMYRARDIFEVEKAIIITQRYHQYRALYTARGLGIDAYGVVSEPRTYSGQSYRELREMLARNKDFFKMLVKPEPTYLGDVIPINGSGLASHD